MPKVFISHSWEDNDISRQIAKNLRRDGAEIWIDYARIIGGDKLPEKIGDALKWCDTLVLIWSKSAVSTHNLSISYKDMNNQEFQTKGKWGKGGIVISQSH